MYLITWITTHLPTPEGWMAELAKARSMQPYIILYKTTLQLGEKLAQGFYTAATWLGIEPRICDTLVRRSTSKTPSHHHMWIYQATCSWDSLQIVRDFSNLDEPFPRLNKYTLWCRVSDVYGSGLSNTDSRLICLTLIDMSKHHCISRYIDNSRPCNGWWCSMLRRIRNCRFIIIVITDVTVHLYWRHHVCVGLGLVLRVPRLWAWRVRGSLWWVSELLCILLVFAFFQINQIKLISVCKNTARFSVTAESHDDYCIALAADY